MPDQEKMAVGENFSRSLPIVADKSPAKKILFFKNSGLWEIQMNYF